MIVPGNDGLEYPPMTPHRAVPLTPHRAVPGFRLLAGLLTALLAVTLLSSLSPREDAEAAVASNFDPGYLISDANFYNGSALSASGVQSFLNQRVPTCKATTGPTCLKSYSMSTPNKAAVAGRCGAYAGGKQSAATIIANVGKACGISQKALLVLIEKEQGLVSSTKPTPGKYRSATGYGCPDTAACSSLYYGFFNQVYNAALQFKRYQANPNSFSYRVGANKILYHPNSACGRKDVTIRNEATRALYIYTPYTPNSAAMSNLYGTGNSCSSYGNRNFWRMYTDWFGAPTGNMSPSGAITGVSWGQRKVTVRGWAVDPNTNDPIRVHVYVDGKQLGATTANREDPATASKYASAGTKHAFSYTGGYVTSGTRNVCVYAINVGAGGNTKLGCSKVYVPGGNPIGNVNSISTTPGAIAFRGWVVDPEKSGPINVHFYVDGVWHSKTTANDPRAGFGAEHAGFGDDHGFAGKLTGISGGTHEVCFKGMNYGQGKNTTFACRTVTMPSGPPAGPLEKAEATEMGTIEVSGWMIDPDTLDPVTASVRVDGVTMATAPADIVRSGPNAAKPGYGDAHGYSFRLEGIAPGSHEVCVYGLNVGVNKQRQVACRTVQMPTGPPFGGIDQMTASPTTKGMVNVRGWAIDPDTDAPLRVHSYVDGVINQKVTADQTKANLAEYYSGFSAEHAFKFNIAGLAAGVRNICLYAINVGDGGTTNLGCRSVTVR